MNAWDIDPNLYLPLFRPLVARLRVWLRQRRESKAAPAADCTAGCRG